MATQLAKLHERADGLAASLPPLMVAAERVATTVSQGVHGRRRVGQGETFWQFRRYHPGDALQRIDWRRSAKSDLVYVRETEWEAAQSVWLWSDASPSMYFRSARNLPEKAKRADLLGLALASLLVRGGEQIAYLGAQMRPSHGRMALNLVAAAMEDRETSDGEGVAGSLPPYEPVPRHGRLVLIGDFLEPLTEINRMIGIFADRGVEGHLLQILDPAEQALPFKGRTRFEGLENEGTALIGRAEGIARQYADEMAAHRRGLKDLAQAAGWTLGLHITDQSPEAALLGLYVALAEPRAY